MLNQAWIFVIFCFVQTVLASPFNRRFKESEESSVTVNCQDLKMVQMLQKSRIPFRCLSGTEKFLEIVLEPSLPIQERIFYGEKMLSDSPTTNVESSKSPNNIRGCRGKKCKNARVCGSSYVYDRFTDMCIPRSVGWPVVPVQKVTSFNTPSYELLTTMQCQMGFEYQPVLRMCLPQSHPYLGASSPTDASKDGYTIIRCDQNSIFVSEVGLCVPLSNVVRPSLMMQRDSPVNPEPLPVPAALLSNSRHMCTSGYIYNPEVDLCLPYMNQPQRFQSSRPASLSLIKERPSKFSMEESQELVGRSKCNKNEVYISELDICVPQPIPMMQNDAPIRDTKDKPIKLTLAPVSADQVGKSKCKNGMVYVSEIDLCVENPSRPKP